jgi:hypothetical protein
MQTSHLIVRTWFFWSWFRFEEVRLRNAVSALVRGEADTDLALQALNARVRRVAPGIEADLSITVDGGCCISFSGDNQAGIEALLDAAPRRTGWRFERAMNDPEPFTPFRRSPPASMDRDPAIAARWEAYAFQG